MGLPWGRPISGIWLKVGPLWLRTGRRPPGGELPDRWTAPRTAAGTARSHPQGPWIPPSFGVSARRDLPCQDHVNPERILQAGGHLPPSRPIRTAREYSNPVGRGVQHGLLPDSDLRRRPGSTRLALVRIEGVGAQIPSQNLTGVITTAPHKAARIDATLHATSPRLPGPMSDFGSRMGAARPCQAVSDAVIVTLRRSLTWANTAAWPVRLTVR